MLKVNQLSGFGGRRSQKGDFEIDLVHAQYDAPANSNFSELTNINVGAPKGGPADNKIVLLHFQTFRLGASGSDISSVTYNGTEVSANLISENAAAIFLFPFTFTFEGSLFKVIDNSSSSTANVTVTHNNAITSMRMSVCVVRNVDNYSQTTSGANTTAGDPVSFARVTTTIPNGESGICLGIGNNSISWSGNSSVQETISNTNMYASLAIINGNGTSQTANLIASGGDKGISLNTVSFTP